MDYSWAKPGVKCVAGDQFRDLSSVQKQARNVSEKGVDIPEYGKIYTISEVGECGLEGMIGILLEGMSFPPMPSGNIYRWPVIAFRPLQDTSKAVEAIKRNAIEAANKQTVKADA